MKWLDSLEFVTGTDSVKRDRLFLEEHHLVARNALSRETIQVTIGYRSSPPRQDRIHVAKALPVGRYR